LFEIRREKSYRESQGLEGVEQSKKPKGLPFEFQTYHTVEWLTRVESFRDNFEKRGVKDEKKKGAKGKKQTP